MCHKHAKKFKLSRLYCRFESLSLAELDTENSINVFPEMKMRGHGPNSDLYIPRIGLLILAAAK
jgi:hypothetical protein